MLIVLLLAPPMMGRYALWQRHVASSTSLPCSIQSAPFLQPIVGEISESTICSSRHHYKKRSSVLASFRSKTSSPAIIGHAFWILMHTSYSLVPPLPYLLLANAAYSLRTREGLLSIKRGYTISYHTITSLRNAGLFLRQLTVKHGLLTISYNIKNWTM
jgi:hypothetical protein